MRRRLIKEGSRERFQPEASDQASLQRKGYLTKILSKAAGLGLLGEERILKSLTEALVEMMLFSFIVMSLGEKAFESRKLGKRVGGFAMRGPKQLK